MAGAVIGALRVSLGIDTAAFNDGIGIAQKRMAAATAKIKATGDQIAGVGAAMSAGITLPFTALVKAAVPAAVESQQALAQVTAALQSMGPVAGRTAEQLQAQAGALQSISNFDDDDILKSVTANMLTFGKVAGEQFDRAQLAAVNLSARLGQDLQSSAIQVGKALNDPIKGVTALQRVGVSFTAQQRDQIKAMVEVGNVAGAQNIILGELEKQFGNSAKAQRDATPDAAMQEQWRTFQETLGALVLKVLPPLTNALTGLLAGFNALSPGLQTAAVGAAALAAAAGPVATAFGVLLRIASPLAGMFAAEGALSLGLAGMAPVLIPLAAAVAGVYLAYQNWDKVGPYIQGVVDRMTQAAADINARLASVQSAADGFDARMGIPSKTDFVDSAKDAVVGAVEKINAGLKWLQDSANAFDAAVARAFSSAVASAQNLYVGVRDWLQTRLGAVFEWVKDKTKQVGDAFFTLYDRVVGHSYVPDMVDEIGEHMGRLDGNMVDQADKTTKATAEKFADMAQTVSGTLQSLGNQIKSKDWLGVLGTLVGVAGKAGIFGKGGGGSSSQGASLGEFGSNTSVGQADLPAFATGGSFQVQGMRGLDRNVLSLNNRPIARVSHGEMVGVGRGGGPSVVQLVVGEGQMFEPRVTSISGGVSVQTVRGANAVAASRQRQALA